MNLHVKKNSFATSLRNKMSDMNNMYFVVDTGYV